MIYIMQLLWKLAERKKGSVQQTTKHFLIYHCLLWSSASLLICLVPGALLGFDVRWLNASLSFIGLSGIGYGFLGGIIFALNQV